MVYLAAEVLLQVAVGRLQAELLLVMAGVRPAEVAGLLELELEPLAEELASVEAVELVVPVLVRFPVLAYLQ